MTLCDTSTSRSVSSKLLIASAAVLTLAAMPAYGASGTWNANSAGNWSDPTKWLSSTVADGADFTATFGDFINADRIVTLNSSRTIGNITASDTSNNYTISGGNILTLDRTIGIPTIDVTTSGRTLTISSVIAGTDGLSKSGAGTLTLSGINQFTGNTVITNGKVTLGAQYALWQSAYDTTGSTGAIGLTVTGQANPWLGGLAGNVNVATAITGYGSVASLNLNPQSGSSVSYGGVIANGAANMTLNKTGHGTQTLTGTNTYSGATTVWAGTLALAGASGTALNSAVTVRGGTLLLDNSTAWADRLNNATALSLGSLTLTSSNGAGIQSEAVGATTFAVGGKVTINNGTTLGDQTTLALGTVTRSAGAAVNFVGTGGTLGAGANSPNVTTSGTFPGGSNGILPWATVNGTTWAGTASANSIVAYAGAFVDPTSAASNAANNAQLTGTGSIATAKNFNSLNVITSGSGESLNLASGANLNLTSGAILKSGTDAYTISSGGGILGAGAGAGTELIAHVDGGALTISAPLDTDINSIAKGGTGDLILSGTRKADFNGNTSIAGGQLEFRGAGFTLSGVVTGAGGLTVNLNAGQTLLLNNNANSYAGPTIVKGGYLSSNAFNNQGMPGGIIQTPGSSNTSLIMSNLVLEGGVFYSRYVTNKDVGAGPGQVQILTGTSGFVHDASSGGAAGFTLDGGRELVWGSTYFNPTAFVHSTTGNSTLNLANGFDLNGSTRTVLVGDATYNTANGVSQLGGNIRNSSGTAGLTKSGIGTLLLSGTNTYNGATTINSGILRFANQVSLYNNTPANWTAANIVVANTGTLALNVGGGGQFTTGNVTTLLTNLGGANGTSTTGFAAGSSIGFDTTSAAGGTFTVADNIANSSGVGGGAVGVVKLGSNTLVLSGNNSYSGPTIIRGGTLSLTGSLTGDTAITTANNNNGGGSTVLNGILNQSAAGVISGPTASFTQGSSGTSVLAGNNSYGGGTTLNAGTLIVGHANALGTGTGTIALNGGTIQSSDATARSFSNPVTIGGNFTVGGTGNMTFSNTGASALGATRTITVANGITAEFAQAFSGATFGITKGATAGTLRLSGTSSYTGATTLESAVGSVLEVSVMTNGGVASSLGNTSNAAANLLMANGTTLRYVGASSASTDRAFTINGTVAGHGVVIEASAVNPLHTLIYSGTGPGLAYGTNNQTRSLTLGGTNTGNNTFGKVIANNGSGATSLVKAGVGTWRLHATNTYTGATAVDAGTLQLGSAGSINPTSGITVAAGAALLQNSSVALTKAPVLNGTGTGAGQRAVLGGGGTGGINAAVTLDNVGDTLSPGNSPGILPFGVSQAWASYSYDFELNDWVNNVVGTDHDQITVAGTLDLSSASANSIVLNVISLQDNNTAGAVGNGGLNTFAETNRSWTIISATTLNGFDPNDWLIDVTQFTDVETGTWSVTQVNQTVQLNYLVPEPSSLGLLAAGAIGLMRRRRVA